MQTAFTPTRYEALGTRTAKCPHCEAEQKLVNGLVYDQNDDLLAMFGATLQQHPNMPRMVILQLGLKAKDSNAHFLEPKDFLLYLLVANGGLGTAVVDPPEERRDRGLTKDQALKSPYLSLVFAIDDFIVENEPDIPSYLGLLRRP